MTDTKDNPDSTTPGSESAVTAPPGLNPLLLAVVGLRAAALGIGIGGRPGTGNALFAVADAVEAGVLTDEHMKLVAQKLKDGALKASDWDDVMQRIGIDRARLHGEPEPKPEPATAETD